MQDVVLHSTSHFQKIKWGIVQILNCGSFPQCIAISIIDAPLATVYVYVSLDELIPRDVVPSITNIDVGKLITTSQPIQVQPNGVTLLNRQNASNKTYDVPSMCMNYKSCLLKGYLKEFPSTWNDNSYKRSPTKMGCFNLCHIWKQVALTRTKHEYLKHALSSNPNHTNSKGCEFTVDFIIQAYVSKSWCLN